ncbi:MAG: aminopeptidase P family protein [Chloroflexi bacterium]|nr:aminopeptidase P family protein [Chloroflexota bacterium]
MVAGKKADPINQRVIQLQGSMAQAGIGMALIVHPRDVFYYAGTTRPSVLVVTPDDCMLFVRRGYERVWKEATISKTRVMGGFESIARWLQPKQLAPGKIGTELDVAPIEVVRRMAAVFPKWGLADISPVVQAQRAIKEVSEIDAMRESCRVADLGMEAASGFLVEGISELALAAEVEAVVRRAGHEGYPPLRDPSARGGGIFVISGHGLTIRGGHGRVITGAGLGPTSPYGPSRRAIRHGDVVVVDMALSVGGYGADEARTFIVGEAPDDQRALMDVASKAQDAVIAALRPGVTGAELYAAADEVAKEGAPPHFNPGSLAIPGFIGHGVGLEVDEIPLLARDDDMPVQKGMTLAIEIEVSAVMKRKMVKLEDVVVVRADGCEFLTHTPRGIIECGV